MRIGEATNRDDLLAALIETRTRRIDDRRGWETIWWNNIALVSGDHYAQWNPTMATFEDRDLSFKPWDDKKPRMVINHALTCARTELAKLTKSQPIMDIIANSDESVDLAAAKVGMAALDYAEWKFKLAKVRKKRGPDVCAACPTTPTSFRARGAVPKFAGCLLLALLCRFRMSAPCPLSRATRTFAG